MKHHNFKFILTAFFAMTLLAFAMPKKAIAAADKSCGITINVNSYSAPFYNPNTQKHSVNSVKETKYVKQSEAGGGNNPDGSARAYFTGSNTSGWSLAVEITVGNYTTTINPYGNAKIYNKDMSNAGGSVTFGVSYSNVNPSVTTTISISGGVDFPKYTLTYDANGGQNAPAQQTINSATAPVEFTIASATPTRANYRFLGWATTADAKTPDVSATFTTSAQDNTIFAVWEKVALPGKIVISCPDLLDNENLVCRVKKGGDVVYTVVVSANASATIINVPTGTYTVETGWAWSYDLTPTTKQVEVTEGQTATAEFSASKKGNLPKHKEVKSKLTF